MTQIEIRHQAAAAGVVTDSVTKAPIIGAPVLISSSPVAFVSWMSLRGLQYGAAWDRMTARPDRTTTSAEGFFYFLDLPDGDYTFTVSLPSAGSRYGTAQAKTTVARDAQGNIQLATSSIALPPTALSGQITGGGKPVVMAEIRIQGSADDARSDAQGKYLFAGVETGMRSVQVFAQGFKPMVQTIAIGAPGSAQTLDFALTSA